MKSRIFKDDYKINSQFLQFESSKYSQEIKRLKKMIESNVFKEMQKEEEVEMVN